MLKFIFCSSAVCLLDQQINTEKLTECENVTMYLGAKLGAKCHHVLGVVIYFLRFEVKVGIVFFFPNVKFL